MAYKYVDSDIKRAIQYAFALKDISKKYARSYG